MQRRALLVPEVGILFLAAFLGSAAAQVSQQTDPLAVRPRARILTAVDDNQRIVLRNNRPLLGPGAVDAGAVPGQRLLQYMMLVLRPADEQQRALDALVKAQHEPASPYYHHWLTPDGYGHRFGVAEADLERIEEWLRGHGFVIDEVARSQRILLFSGTAQQVEEAFHPTLRQFVMNGGERRMANAADPSIPAAMAGVVEGVASLHDFYSRPMGRADRIQPNWTSGGSHYLAPADFATIYNVRTLYNQGLDGTGLAIAIAGRSNVTLNDVATFRSNFALPAKAPSVILVNSNPGIVSGDYSESMLDVEWAGAVAKGATIDFVTAASTGTSDGIFLAIQYIVNHNVAPVVSLSYGECEAYMGAAANSMVNSLWQQAASQGMSVFVSSGDSGAAGCDGSSSTRATAGKAVNGLCSSPYSTCVGGTQLDDTSNPSLYWSSSNGSDGSSALSYIPEKVWNESGSNGLWSSGGGVSILYAKPTWQNVTGMPADGMRDVPDVSLTAAGHVGYLVVMQGATYIFSGTSAAAPSFAGIMALNVQSAGGPQGNPNPTLYTLASRQFAGGTPSVFHDVQSGNNSVPGQAGFSAGVGYDAATGLGSVDVGQLIAHWSDNTGAPSVALSSTNSSASLQPGAPTSLTLTSTTSNGFNSALAFSVTGLPVGVTASFLPATIAAPGSGTSSLRLTATSTAAPSTEVIIVRASGSGFAATLQLTLTVLPPPSFTLSASLPAATVLPSGTTNIIVTATGNTTFDSAVTFRASGLPSTLTASFSPAVVAAPGSGSSTMTIATNGAAPGVYWLAVTATAGTLSHSLKIGVTVEGIVLTSSPNPAVYGAAITFTATTFGVPQSTVVFLDNGTSVGSAIAPYGGSASFTTSSLSPGTHNIKASANGVTSAALQQSVKAVLTITANNVSRTYGAANPALSFTFSGWVGGDTLAVVAGAPSLSTTATTASSVGNYPIMPKVGTLSSANYSFTFVDGTLTVTKASPAIVLISSQNPSTYGTRITFTASVSSGGPAATVVFYDGSSSLGGTVLSGSTAVLSTATLRAGSHSITASLTGNNYNAATSNTVSQTVNKAALTVTATGASTYGAALGTLTPVYRGFVNGETAGVALTGAASLSTTATPSSAAGVYAITVAAGSLAAANYALSYVAGNLTISKAVLTVTANNATRSYGTANPPFTASCSGWTNGDTPAVLTGAAGGTTNAGLTSAVGAYPINPTVGTLAATNYSFRFVSGTLRIVQATPTVTLSSATNPSVSGARTSYRVTVAPGGSGTVMLCDSGAYLGSASLSGTVATITVALRTGSHSLTATVTGANYMQATSAAIVQTVQ